MNFTCNTSKNETNIRERGLLLLAARGMFTNKLIVREDVRKVYSERRFIGYNIIDGRLLVVVFCKITDNITRIISFRKANKREQKRFDTQTL